MTNERLEEIKDSIEFQEILLKENILTKEEKELYDEVVRLKDIIDKAIEFIENNTERAIVNGENQFLIDQEDIPIILNILKGSEKE